MGRPRIVEVARAAGVSRATAAHVRSGATNVDPTMAAAVEIAAKELGYDRLSGTFFTAVLKGAAKGLSMGEVQPVLLPADHPDGELVPGSCDRVRWTGRSSSSSTRSPTSSRRSRRLRCRSRGWAARAWRSTPARLSSTPTTMAVASWPHKPSWVPGAGAWASSPARPTWSPPAPGLGGETTSSSGTASCPVPPCTATSR